MEALYDEFPGLPFRPVIGNHDLSEATRTDFYNNMSQFAEQPYDNSDYPNRMDYTFDVEGVRFIVFDNVNQFPGSSSGYRWASPNTLSFLQSELAKVSDDGIDEGMPMILMSHARNDCLVRRGCNQKINHH